MTVRILAACFALASVTVCLSGRGSAQDQARKAPDALDKKIDLSLSKTPLDQAISLLSDKIGTPILIDSKALKGAGVSPSQPVTIELRSVSARSALRLITAGLQLSFTERNGIVFVTTPEAASGELRTRLTPVAHLVVRDETVDFRPLIDMITTVVEPDSWDGVGGPGSVAGFSGSLVVSQTESVHAQVKQLLQGLKKVHDRKPDDLTTVMVGTADRIRTALEQPAEFEFDKIPLTDVASYVADHFQVPVIVDRDSLEAAGMTAAMPISFRLSKAALRVALREMLSAHKLDFYVRDEVLMISGERKRLGIHLYPVPDLGSSVEEMDRLIKLIEATERPDSWDSVGGPGSCTFMIHPRPVLVVSQTESTHELIEGLLRQIRAARAEEIKQNPEIAEVTPPARLKVLRSYPLPESDTAEVIEALVRKLLPDLWAEPHALLASTKGRLVVRHHQAGHEQVLRILRMLGIKVVAGGGLGGSGLEGGGFF